MRKRRTQINKEPTKNMGTGIQNREKDREKKLEQEKKNKKRRQEGMQKLFPDTVKTQGETKKRKKDKTKTFPAEKENKKMPKRFTNQPARNQLHTTKKQRIDCPIKKSFSDYTSKRAKSERSPKKLQQRG